ncbi:MAG: hypothetical protein ACOC4H_02695 [bacterium]
MKIKGNAVFGEVSMPNSRSVVFGGGDYESESYDKNSPHHYIEANAVFGAVQIK